MDIKMRAIAILLISGFLFSCSSTQKGETSKKQKDGTGEISWDDGSLKGKGPFKNHQQVGDWVLYHRDSGEKLAKGKYANDKQNGQWIYFHKNGQKSFEGEFKNGQKTGKWIGYYDTGELKSKAKYKITKIGILEVGGIHGTKRTFYKTGKVLKEEQYRNGLKNGRSQEYYKNGQPKEISMFTENKHNGKLNKWWENGKPKEKGFYKNDVKTGAWKFFYENGLLRMSGNFKLGKLKLKGKTQLTSQMVGHWQFYAPRGRLQKEGEYKNGKEKGYWKFYAYPNPRRQVLAMELMLTGGMAKKGRIYENSKLTGEGDLMGIVKGIYEMHVDNKRTKEINASDAPPDITAKKITYKWTGKWIVPKKTGKWTEYYPGGKKKKTVAKYMMNKLSGPYKEYFKNGKVKAEGEYMNGKKSGMWKVFNKNGKLNKEESGRWMMGKKSKL